MKHSWIYLFAILGFLAPFIHIIIWNLTHQKEIKEAVNTGQPNAQYSDKIPVNYSKKEKSLTLLIGGYLILMGLIAISFLYLGYYYIIPIIIFIALLGWKLLISRGNNTQKQ
jgi:hypothetical protein